MFWPLGGMEFIAFEASLSPKFVPIDPISQWFFRFSFHCWGTLFCPTSYIIQYIYILYRFDVPFWLEFAVVVLGLGMFDDANEQNRSLAKEAVLKVQA